MHSSSRWMHLRQLEGDDEPGSKVGSEGPWHRILATRHGIHASVVLCLLGSVMLLVKLLAVSVDWTL